MLFDYEEEEENNNIFCSAGRHLSKPKAQNDNKPRLQS
jgi:hypothetical protein